MKKRVYLFIVLSIFIQIIFPLFALPSAFASGNDASKKPVYLGEISSTYLKKILTEEEKELKKTDLKFTREEIFKSTQSKLIVARPNLRQHPPSAAQRKPYP